MRAGAAVAWMVTACAALLLLAACAGSAAVEEPSAQEEAADSLWVMAYQSWRMPRAWEGYELDMFDTVFFSELEAAPDGSLKDVHGWPGDWQHLRSAARRREVRLVPVVRVPGSEAFTQLFSRPIAVAALRRNVVRIMQSGATAGVQIDARVREAVPPEARAGFARFARALRSDLDTYAAGAQLSFFVPPFDTPDVFDERLLAEAADFLVVQGYDLYWSSSTRAGPPAPLRGWYDLNWQAVTTHYAQQGVPMEKIVMAAPAFGYEWPTVSAELGARTRGQGRLIGAAPPADSVAGTGARAVAQVSAQARAEVHGLRRDSTSRAPYYVYRNGSGWRQGWFEDAQSLEAKRAFVQKEGMAGIALFALGYGDEALVQALLQVPSQAMQLEESHAEESGASGSTETGRAPQEDRTTRLR